MGTSTTASSSAIGARYFNAYRVASYLLVLYALGHTLGAVVATPRLGVESDRVVDLMKSVHVTSQGADCTWYGFYRGFGIYVSMFMVFSAAVAWIVGGMSAPERRLVRPLTVLLSLTYAASIPLDVVYFGRRQLHSPTDDNYISPSTSFDLGPSVVVVVVVVRASFCASPASSARTLVPVSSRITAW